MTHNERLPECEAFQCRLEEDVRKHIDESGPVREAVNKHSLEILQMTVDIADIKRRLESQSKDFTALQLIIVQNNAAMDKKLDGIKIWILTAAIAGLMTLLGFAVYYGGYTRQIEVNTKWIERQMNTSGSVH